MIYVRDSSTSAVIVIVCICEPCVASNRDGAGNTVEENSSVFSLIRMR